MSIPATTTSRCNHTRHHLLAAMLLPCLAGAGTVPTGVAAPRLSTDSEIANAGYYHISWETDAARVELQEADNPAFIEPTTRYIGPDRATVISGKPDGAWYYRTRAFQEGQRSPWSEPVAVTVSHHPLGRAAGFFLLGLLVFLGVLIVVIRGARHPAGSETHS